MVLLKRKDMKKLIYTSILALLLSGVGVSKAQDTPQEYLGLPGDNLNLYAVMDLFQKSETLEGFERSLNDENSRINNLDLNGDNMVDYITISDYVEDNVHNIVLRVALNKDDYQDVAVFTVEKFADGSVQIQLIGDEALYGKNYIIEPNYAETPNPGYRGNVNSTARVEVVTTTYRDIARWPLIVYIYRPGYNAWRSAWYWNYWPSYWYAWTPYYWDYYYGYYYNWYPHYYAYYRHWDHYRGHWYNDYYYNRVRMYSPTVVVNIHKDYYRSTYSRPDLRKDGEEAYSRERGNRTNGNQNETNNSRVDRRSVNQSTGDQDRVKTGTGTYKSERSSSNGRSTENIRRSGGSVNKSSGSTGSTGRTSGSDRRPTTEVNKSSGNNSTGRSSGTVHRSTSSGSDRNIGRSSSSKSSGSVHRSTSSGRSSGSGSRSASGKGSSSRSSGSSKSTSGHSRR
jgi:hypothetical protein